MLEIFKYQGTKIPFFRYRVVGMRNSAKSTIGGIQVMYFIIAGDMQCERGSSQASFITDRVIGD